MKLFEGVADGVAFPRVVIERASEHLAVAQRALEHQDYDEVVRLVRLAGGEFLEPGRSPQSELQKQTAALIDSCRRHGVDRTAAMRLLERMRALWALYVMGAG